MFMPVSYTTRVIFQILVHLSAIGARFPKITPHAPASNSITMHTLYRAVILGLLLISFGPAFAQSGCVYQLQLHDIKGDGWGGGRLVVTIDGAERTYTLPQGEFASHSLYITEGDSLDLFYEPGLFSFESYFLLFNAEGEEVFRGGQNGIYGLIFGARAVCPPCPDLFPDSLQITDIRHDRARVKWSPNDADATYRLYIVPAGNAPDIDQPDQLVTGTSNAVGGFQERSEYDVYLSAACSNGEVTPLIGPVSFRTLSATDVGIVDIVSPASACGLPDMAPVQLRLRNFGGQPQSLIPFYYSINGVTVPVDRPRDGVFTGVLGYSQEKIVTFDIPVDLSEPGTYQLQAWTALPGDQNPANDTISLTVVNTPVIDQFPYAENFESGDGGWRIGEDSRNSSLQYGRPAANIIRQAAGGDFAWVTNLSGNYNRNELSYLLSPCLDLSALDQDPELSFFLFVVTESGFDGAWVETSIDGGENWSKLGRKDTVGTFWYNLVDSEFGDWWSGENIFGNWRRVSYPLTGMAGQDDVRIRFVFRSDPAVFREGIGIDDIFISQPLEHNLVATAVRNKATDDCGSEADIVSLTIRNDGEVTQSDFEVAYQINSGAIVTESPSIAITPDKSATYAFQTPFRSDVPEMYHIKAWTISSQEQFTTDDTTIFVYSTLGLPPPYFADFEQSDPPTGWAFDEDFNIDDSHNSPSSVLYDNLYSVDPVFVATTPLIGPVQEEDSLFFDYRFVDFVGQGTQPKILQPGDSLIVEISLDCSDIFSPLFNITQANHQTRNTMRRLALPLSAYSGGWVKVRFRAVWGQGDYYVDLDNINIKRCPADLQLSAETVLPSADGEDGSILIIPAAGLAPYRFRWDNGADQAELTGLASGEYRVSVTDRQGCTDQLTVKLDETVAADEPHASLGQIRLFPNPSPGRSRLSLTTDRTSRLSIVVLDAQGRSVRSYHESLPAGTSSLVIDLQGLADGLYFIRMMTTEQVKTLRLLKVSH